MSLSLRLIPDFRLVHQPVGTTEAGCLLGTPDLAGRLTDRLAHSDGGSFLLTGLRGTGKTTTLHHALSAWRLENTTERIIDVRLVLARPMDEEALLFEIIRRLFEELTRQDLLSELPEDVRQALLVAYARTSYSQKQTHTATKESQSGVEFGGSLGLGKGVALPLPKRSWGRKTAETKATELSFLAYSPSDAEHDFLRILSLLSVPHPRLGSRWRRAGRKVVRRKPPLLVLRVVIALDEVDKLTGTDEGQEAFERLLSALKNTFSVSNVHVIIVAGIDQHDRWLTEAATTDSLYRSIFAWHAYQPCLWGHARQLVDANLDKGQDPLDADVLANYLEFRGRGIVRALLAEFNELVEWRDGAPVIELTGVVEQRVRLIADVQAAMREALTALSSTTVLSSPATEDRWRSEAYYAVDWALRTNGQPFTITDVLVGLDGDPETEIDTERAQRLQDLFAELVDASILQERDRNAGSITVGGPDDEPPSTQYWLDHAFLDRLHQIVRADPLARVEILSGGEEGRNPLIEEAQRAAGDRYSIVRTLASGRNGGVYVARERDSGETVVLKLARRRGLEESRRISAEGKLLSELEHPNIVEFVDRLPNGFVMRLVPGVDLDHVIGQSAANTVDASDVVSTGVQLLDAVGYLEGQGIRHLDIKPSNIVLAPTGDVVLVDLGSASQARRASLDADSFFGTPKWAAPERRQGARSDARSELYSIALVLCELLGIPATGSPDAGALVAEQGRGRCSQELLDVLVRALSIDPTERFETPAAMRDALLHVPEYEPRRPASLRLTGASTIFTRPEPTKPAGPD